VTGRPELADAIAAVLEQGGPTSANAIALNVRARRKVLLEVLRDAPRFERLGRGRRTVWRLAGTGREPLHGVARPAPDQDVTLVLLDALRAVQARLDELAAIPSRLDAIERRLAEVERARSSTDDRALPGQITVDEAIAAVNGEAPAA
jgi:hypothetical protein